MVSTAIHQRIMELEQRIGFIDSTMNEIQNAQLTILAGNKQIYEGLKEQEKKNEELDNKFKTTLEGIRGIAVGISINFQSLEKRIERLEGDTECP